MHVGGKCSRLLLLPCNRNNPGEKLLDVFRLAELRSVNNTERSQHICSIKNNEGGGGVPTPVQHRLRLCGFLRSKAVDVPEAGGVTVVVCDHDGGIKWLEVQYDQRVAVEARLGLHDQREALRRPLLGSLLDAGRHGDVVQRFGHPQHHGLDAVLWDQEQEVHEFLYFNWLCWSIDFCHIIKTIKHWQIPIQFVTHWNWNSPTAT